MLTLEKNKLCTSEDNYCVGRKVQWKSSLRYERNGVSRQQWQSRCEMGCFPGSVPESHNFSMGKE